MKSLLLKRFFVYYGEATHYLETMIEEIIKERRSVSCFSDKPLERSLIDEIIKLSSYAPSSCNTQPWYFVVFLTEDSKNRLKRYIDEGYRRTSGKLGGFSAPLLKRLLEFFSRYGKFNNAPVYILLFSRPYDTPLFSQAIKLSKQDGVMGVAEESVKTSVAMAMQNFLLVVHEKGLGARVKDGIKFLLNFEDLKREFYDEFSIPKEYMLVSGIQLGYPVEGDQAKGKKERLPLEKIRKYI